MARGRMIDRRISKSKKLASLRNEKSRVLYFMIYPHLDCEGRIAFDDLQDLKIEIIPYFKNWTIRTIESALCELNNIELIQIYPFKNQIAIQFNRFEDFQLGLRKDREAKSDIPAPEEILKNPELLQSCSGVTPALSLSIRKLKEGRKEGNIYYDFESSKWKNISEKDIELWKKTYPACDIEHELLAMGDWLISNPERRKSNYRAFISRWLKRQQDQGGSKKGRQSMPPGYPSRKQQIREQTAAAIEQELKEKENKDGI